MKTIDFFVNGTEISVTCSPSKTLLEVLREDAGLTGSKECCGKGECGSCTVSLNGLPVCSCLVLAGQVHGENIITVEGIGTPENMDPVQQAFMDEGATQCGYCTPGLIVSARSYLNSIGHLPGLDEIKQALGGNLCRCTGYTKILKAVQTAAEKQLTFREL
ncbi:MULTISPECIES: (2Fe-2S)-binding protein [Fictibacillus]|uniref:Ferredoxin n=1 Tax=Fictibacillus enclensis TaxID=1017270 RepID=A0A0V8JCW2_9BACL|nr:MULTISPECIES: (2Fe-2S)-binding protein [Fictibacillus]KSU84680.1 ferredoxin [Fictibacillus enclensis]RXY99668.1 (2Fe-2S)-binding protein [Fictibacillus sp. S7]SCB83640.1 purine hydroxylase delta subunit apoprotein [Fictibacillus enclensis]